MRTAEKIFNHLKNLPEKQQEKVLEFIENFVVISKTDLASNESDYWNDLSITSAMRGMEDENEPEYKIEDLKEVFDEKGRTNSPF